MTELATLIEKRRIAQNRLNMNIKRKPSEIAELNDEIKAYDRAIDLIRLKEVEDDNERE